jgi:hypothetical protein
MPYVGYVTILLSEHPWLKTVMIGLMGLMVIMQREWTQGGWMFKLGLKGAALSRPRSFKNSTMQFRFPTVAVPHMLGCSRCDNVTDLLRSRW